MADFTAIQNALWDAVKKGSALPDDQIVWADQNGPAKPTAPHVVLRLLDDQPLGGAPEIRRSYNGAAPAGQEITITVREVAEFGWLVQVLGGTSHGNGSNRALATKIQRTLALPSVTDALNAVGVSCFDRGAIQNVSAVLDADFEARAIFEARLRMSDSVAEAIGYIATVEVEDQIRGNIFTIG